MELVIADIVQMANVDLVHTVTGLVNSREFSFAMNNDQQRTRVKHG